MARGAVAPFLGGERSLPLVGMAEWKMGRNRPTTPTTSASTTGIARCLAANRWTAGADQRAIQSAAIRVNAGRTCIM